MSIRTCCNQEDRRRRKTPSHMIYVQSVADRVKSNLVNTSFSFVDFRFKSDYCNVLLL